MNLESKTSFVTERVQTNMKIINRGGQKINVISLNYVIVLSEKVHALIYDNYSRVR